MLASAEGIGGINKEKCAKKLEPDSDGSFYYKCDSQTTENIMFECPSFVTKGDRNPFEGDYECYKF